MYFIGIYTVCNMGGRGLGCVENIYKSYTLCIWHIPNLQNPNLQNCFTTPKQKPRRGGGLTQINTAAKSFTGQFLRKSILTWSLLVIGPWVKASSETREMRKGQERGRDCEAWNAAKMKNRKRTGTRTRWKAKNDRNADTMRKMWKRTWSGQASQYVLFLTRNPQWLCWAS